MIPTPKPTWSIKNLFFALENENYLPKYKLDIRMNDDVNCLIDCFFTEGRKFVAEQLANQTIPFFADQSNLCKPKLSRGAFFTC
ncbi:hypothetical protein T4C_3861 [Trichinella pseudospiralis]|uniref:Uncharacterized protein n=1 Tax=Trichinella pseudospiralis TaxID=6337 RepID=A0A0V1IV20_TRIPS|nr:hypothetical protein T4C_3861 [Trichinella pseudospiralis]